MKLKSKHLALLFLFLFVIWLGFLVGRKLATDLHEETLVIQIPAPPSAPPVEKTPDPIPAHPLAKPQFLFPFNFLFSKPTPPAEPGSWEWYRQLGPDPCDGVSITRLTAQSCAQRVLNAI